MKEIILTNTGKLGDFLYCLPIASWLARMRNCKIYWVLPGSFGPFNYITNLLMLQPFTSRVSIVPYQVRDYNCGGQPYRFNPAEFDIGGEYYNLGFRGYPDKYVSAFYAEEHGFDYDRDFRLWLYDETWIDEKPEFTEEEIQKIKEAKPLSEQERTVVRNYARKIHEEGEILRSTEWGMSKLVPHATPMPQNEDLLVLARRMAAAKEVNTWFCGLAVLACMARIPVIVHRVPGHALIPLYYEGDCRHVTFVEHSKEEVE